MSAIKAISLHIGVNELDPAGYQFKSAKTGQMEGWVGALKGCEHDANAYFDIAVSQGFNAEKLLTKKATVANVKAAVKKAAETLDAGDVFFITYAGHGGQIPDESGDEALRPDPNAAPSFAIDGMDETWCLHDRHLIDDEKHVMFLDFLPGVRIVEVNDSCHSGGMDRGIDDEPVEVAPYRGQPGGLVHPCYYAYKSMYDGIQEEFKERTLMDLRASLIHLSACKATELAGDGYPHGKFTEALTTTWKRWIDESIDGNYKKFHQDVVAKVGELFKVDKAAHSRGERKHAPIEQTPLISQLGVPNDAFMNEKPFSK